MRKINDRIILGLLTGIIANIPKTLGNEYLYRRGIDKRRFGDLVAGVFLPSYRVRSKKGTIFGTIGDMFVSSLFGVPLVYLLTYTGKDKTGIKGLMTGLFAFGLFRGIISRVGISTTYPKDVVTNVMMSAISSLWGLTAGLLIPLLGNRDLFEPKPRVQSNPPYNSAELN